MATNPARLLTLAILGNNPIVAWDTTKVKDAAALSVACSFSALRLWAARVS